VLLPIMLGGPVVTVWHMGTLSNTNSINAIAISYLMARAVFVHKE
jgi:hypothetical protein